MTTRPYSRAVQHSAHRDQSLHKVSRQLGLKALDLVQASKAENTRRAYRSDWRHWSAWCERLELADGTVGVSAMPADPALVSLYLAAHAGTLSAATLGRRLSSIAMAHQLAGHPSPVTEAVSATLAGLRRTYGRPPKAAPPLLADGIRAAVDAMSGDDLADARDRALLLLGWRAAMRRSELAGLRWGNVAELADGIVVTLEHSKTDRLGIGQTVAVPVEAERRAYCAVRAMQAWRARLEQHQGITVSDDAPVFVTIDRWGNPAADAMSGHAVGAVITRRAAAVGIDGMTGHSLRVGLIWEASRAGRHDSEIMQTTRHQGITMLRRYQRDAGAMERAAGRGLL